MPTWAKDTTRNHSVEADAQVVCRVPRKTIQPAPPNDVGRVEWLKKGEESKAATLQDKHTRDTLVGWKVVLVPADTFPHPISQHHPEHQINGWSNVCFILYHLISSYNSYVACILLKIKNSMKSKLPQPATIT